MNDERQSESERELADVVTALRELPAPDGPDDVFHERLVVGLEAALRRPDETLSTRKTWSPAMRRILTIAATLVFVSVTWAVIGWLTSMDRATGGSAFARMLELVESARTVTFTTRIELLRQNSHTMESKTMVLEPDWTREEMFEGKDRHQTILIQNGKLRKSLSLMPAEKKAVLRTMAVPEGVRPKNILQQLREVREASSQLLGTEKIDGKEARKYRCDHPTGHYLIWIATDCDLPVKVEMSESADVSQNVKITMTDFQWNVPLDESLFTLEVPQSYTLEEEPAGKELDSKDFIATMKAFVRLNSNQFPDEYNSLSTGLMIKFLDDPSLPPEKRMASYRHRLSDALEHPEWDKLTNDQWKEKGHEVGRTFAQGAVFLQILAQTNDWHYVGKGAKLGEKDRIVAWWAPKDAGAKSDQPKMATVLYADFHMDTKPSAGLPTSN